MMVEGYESLKAADSVSVDILEVSRSRDLKVEAKEDPDATENSSSFADTFSGNENASSFSDAEVESHFIPDIGLDPTFDEFGSVFPIRKKKLTAHWRNFIHPLMWRCKWTELRIKQLESQASKYARQGSMNHMAQDKTTVEQLGSNSLPISIQGHRNRPMKRRKRRRVENTSDIASYMANHIIFSDRENKRPDLDGVPTWENNDNHDEFGLNGDHSFREENDDLLHHILRKIELVHSRVQKLRNQLDVVLINNASRFSSSEDLSQLMGGGIHSPTFSACNGDTGLYASSPYIGDYDIEDFDLLDCEEVSSFGEPFSIPDIIESSVGLLYSVDVTQHQNQIGDSSEKIVDNILIQHEAAEVEGANQFADKAQDAEEESNNKASILGDVEANTLKSCLTSQIYFPKNKRKRGERKAASGNWSRHWPGEPCS
ncbi:uncharacterized protein LOC121781149 [Salvia splendens]|uniref:uncharacterized protein LOC121781149 n=1 Tax=Salvia splendens TaxID=180675 RepID=UPI001C27EA81|nr:uncharacterized protein LOC121781149 [Salvia splendens]XP_042034785.1 uncharacterized protein LOC121781149 [Salvia splendens]XP_042034786.1 uncharacterized protein LOC121781149 [Salvia splendens]